MNSLGFVAIAIASRGTCNLHACRILAVSDSNSLLGLAPISEKLLHAWRAFKRYRGNNIAMYNSILMDNLTTVTFMHGCANS